MYTDYFSLFANISNWELPMTSPITILFLSFLKKIKSYMLNLNSVSNQIIFLSVCTLWTNIENFNWIGSLKIHENEWLKKLKNRHKFNSTE